MPDWITTAEAAKISGYHRKAYSPVGNCWQCEGAKIRPIVAS